MAFSYAVDMAASSTVTQLNTRVAAAVEAIDAGDYAAALTKLLGAKALLVSLPSRSARGGAEGTELEWDGAAIDSLIEQVRKLKSAAVGVQRTPVRYETTPVVDE